MTNYNKIHFDYAPWGMIDGYQEVVDGYETRLLSLNGEELPIVGAQYGYFITEANVTPPVINAQ
jgi:hypothetical protein